MNNRIVQYLLLAWFICVLLSYGYLVILPKLIP
jgi:hypothetical protein